jgi:rRNA maturation endonuclease Nob1
MGLIDKIKSAVVMKGPDEQFTYECQDCGTLFDSEAVSRTKATCPQCGSDDVHSTPEKVPAA